MNAEIQKSAEQPQVHLDKGVTSDVRGDTGRTAARYYIASLKHTHKHHEHITFWGPNHRGYVLVISDGYTGEYSVEQAEKLNDGESYIAVPVDAAKALLSPEPYFRPGNPARFYDTPGPVIDNTRANWNRLIAAAMPGRTSRPKPEVYRGTRRSFALAA